MRTECKDCGGPMDNSHSASYCRSCHNARQRAYARQRLQARGYGVKAKILDEDAQRRLMDAAGKPGLCHLCSEQEPQSLGLVYVVDSDKSTITPLLLACRQCADLLRKIDEPAWARWQAIVRTLAGRSLRLGDVSLG